MLAQAHIIEQIELNCKADERVAAAMLYGSFIFGEGDRFSDVDCFIFFEEWGLEMSAELAGRLGLSRREDLVERLGAYFHSLTE